MLIELAYVTNKEDAENLKSDKWRDKVSDSILTAIENYFSNQTVRACRCSLAGTLNRTNIDTPASTG